MKVDSITPKHYKGPDMNELNEIIKLLNQLEEKRSSKDIISDLNAVREKCCCDKTPATSLRNFQPLNTGVCVLLNNVCKGCAEGEKLDREMTRVVCYSCKKVLARIPAHIDDDGFEFKAGTTVHLAKCPGCVPGTEESVIAEKVIFARKRNPNKG